MQHASLFTPVSLGSLALTNRIVMAPLTRCRADANHVPTALMAEYYAQLGEQRRRRGRTAGRDRQAAAQPGRGQPAGLPRTARAPTPSRCMPSPTRPSMCWRMSSRSRPIPSSASSASSACTRARSRRAASSTSATAASPSRSAHLFMLQGKEHVEVPRACPGDICAVAKVDETALRRGAARRRRGRAHPPEAAGLPGAGARPGDRAQAPRRRAAHVGDPAASWWPRTRA